MNTEASARVPDDDHRRPTGATDELVEAVGRLSEALEWVERARGHLYEFHQLMGHADELFGTAAEALEGAGDAERAHTLRTDVVGRNVLDGRWSFQIVDEYDDTYYSKFKELEQEARDDLVGGRRHLFEAEMKEERRTPGQPHHEAAPKDH